MHNIHINDAVEAYKKIDRVNTPEHAKPFDLAMVNITVRKINGLGRKSKVIQLSAKEYKSYLAILEQS
jgi:hypothetical protein